MNKKIAIVYDWMDKWGGVERLLLNLHKAFPYAPFYTSFYDKNLKWIKDIKIIPSFIQSLPSFIKNSRKLSLTFFPYAFESFDFSDFDTVISVSSSFAKGIITKPNTKHINIMLTPTRFLWSHNYEYINTTTNYFLKPYIDKLKKWDIIASKRPDIIFSISKNVQNRCKKYYNLSSELLYPLFDIEYWSEIKKNISNNGTQETPYYLAVSRLEPYKKIDLLVDTFSKINKKLKIVGNGSLHKKLSNKKHKNIEFIKSVSDNSLAKLYTDAKALIMPQDEDFGYVSLEAQFFGCPIITYKTSGATETILENKTGLIFNKQTSNSLQEVLEKYETLQYTMKTYLKNIDKNYFNKFSKDNFISNLAKYI